MRKLIIILCFSSFMGTLTAQKNSVGFQALDVSIGSFYYERQFIKKENFEYAGRIVLPIVNYSGWFSPLGFQQVLYYGKTHRIELGIGIYPYIELPDVINIGINRHFNGTSWLGYVYSKRESPWSFRAGIQLQRMFLSVESKKTENVVPKIYPAPYLGVSYRF